MAEVWWDAGTGLRCSGMLAQGSDVPLICAAPAQLQGFSAPALHQHRSPSYWEVQERLAGEHRVPIWVSNARVSVQPFTVPCWGLQRIQVCSLKAY